MRLPTVEDFTVCERPEEDLDGFSAWKSFGALTIDEAYAKFCGCPEGYQEDFMWMGDRAFAFYFPVVDRYLREEEPKRGFDGEAYLLAHGIRMHVPGRVPEVLALHDRIASLCDFVLDGLRGHREREGRCRPVDEVASAWRDLRTKVDSSSADSAT